MILNLKIEFIEDLCIFVKNVISIEEVYFRRCSILFCDLQGSDTAAQAVTRAIPIGLRTVLWHH